MLWAFASKAAEKNLVCVQIDSTCDGTECTACWCIPLSKCNLELISCLLKLLHFGDEDKQGGILWGPKEFFWKWEPGSLWVGALERKMANLVGTVTPFDSQSQSWEEYCEILQHFFEANEITEATKQKAILLSSVGSQTYSLLRNLLSPVKPGSKTVDELMDLLKQHFNPKPSEIVQRFKFNSRSREEGETVLDYVAVLRKLAHDCNYGEKLTEMLRDRLVCGINDDRIQRRLLAETDLTFEKALKIAQAMETANKDVRDLQAQRPETSISGRVHKTSVNPSRGSIFNWLAGAATDRSCDPPVATGSCQNQTGSCQWLLAAASLVLAGHVTFQWLSGSVWSERALRV